MSYGPLNQKGFAAIEGVLVVIVLAIIGGTGYYIYNANSKATDIQNAAQTRANSATPPNGSGPSADGQGGKTKKAEQPKTEAYIISEWKVAAVIPTPPNNAALIQYKIKSSGQQSYAQFTTQELLDADSDCNANHYPAGVIVRAAGKSPFYLADGTASGKTVEQALMSGSYKPYRQVGGYYYWYVSSQAACSNNPKTNQLQQSAAAEVKQIVLHLEKE